MTIAIYETKGQLVRAIPDDGVAEAQRYLTHDHEGNPNNMEQYLDPPLKGVVADLRWELAGNGLDYTVRATCERELTDDELKKLSEEVSGQNSDGLGEGFEQQDFAWVQEHDDSWDWLHDTDGETYEDEGRMCSFDWQTNELPWTRVK